MTATLCLMCDPPSYRWNYLSDNSTCRIKMRVWWLDCPRYWTRPPNPDYTNEHFWWSIVLYMFFRSQEVEKTEETTEETTEVKAEDKTEEEAKPEAEAKPEEKPE